MRHAVRSAPLLALYNIRKKSRNLNHYMRDLQCSLLSVPQTGLPTLPCGQAQGTVPTAQQAARNV